eukprot:m.295919 g.295919  ORF g.295919 m.295919 type:complete len:914 (+) comp13288_c0_seq1:1-2742(+)
MAHRRAAVPAVLLLVLLAAAPIRGAVKMPGYFGDNMVLQTNAEYGARSFLNGFAAPHEQVSITVKEASSGSRSDEKGGLTSVFTTTADAQGDFLVMLDPLTQGHSFTISVQGENGPPVTASPVLAGDVILCSGQSNMQFPVKLTLNASDEIKSADDPKYKNVRLLTVPRAAVPDHEAKDFAANVTWELLSSNTVPEFSAVCFMTAKTLIDLHLGNRPVGLIMAVNSGTRVEAWASPAALKTCTDRGFVIPPAMDGANRPSVLWNGMIAPIKHVSIRAAIWYQGEANAQQSQPFSIVSDYYECFLGSMIADWRLTKGIGDFPFVLMQLPPSQPPDSSPAVLSGRPQIREAERRLVPSNNGTMDVTGMAVVLDMGGKSAWGWDHPPNKNTMSWRLGLQVLHVAYALQGSIPLPQGGSTIWTGPLVQQVDYVPTLNTVQIIFESWTAQGLRFKPVFNCTTCCNTSPFEMFNGTTWVTAEAQIQGITVSVLSPWAAGTELQLRYAWTDFVQCVVTNDDDLLLTPFSATPQSTLSHKNMKARESALTVPPMGFNSWNFYHCNIDEVTIKAIADAMVANGMREAGYRYVNIDDCWQVARNPDGTIVPDPVRFPSGMAALADYVHSRGLLFGLYTAQGSRTCQSRPGAYNYELIDAATYCEWGVDYLKIDNCGGEHHQQNNESWILFHQGFEKCFNQSGHYIVESIEYCKSPSECGQWIGGVANLWRTTPDIQANWKSMIANINHQNDMAPVARQGHYNDPDMLQVGNVGLSYEEQRAHFALWCLASAPLLAGTDLIHASNETLALLTAPGPIRVNQDPGTPARGVQGTLVNATVPMQQVWAKFLSDGSVAVILLNLNEADTVWITVWWSDLGVKPETPLEITDLWTGKVISPSQTYSFSQQVAGHSHGFYQIAPSKRHP